jgi:hypothetical protein
MSGNDEINVKIGAQNAGLLSGLKAAEQAVASSSGYIRASLSGITDVVERIKLPFIELAAIMAGGMMFKEVIGGTVEWTNDIVTLSKRLGITTEEASGLKVALDHLGISSDEYGGILTKVTRQMRTNEQAFESMGIKTHDANGQWRNSQAVMTDVIARLNEMKPGTDRNVAAMALMGGRVGDLTNLLRLNADMIAESTAKAEAFHLIVGPDGEAKMLRYKGAMADLKLVMESLKVQVGNALIPTLTQLATQMGNDGPKAANFFASSIKFIAEAALEAWAAINALVEAVKFGVILLNTPVDSHWLSTITKAYHDMGDAVLAVNDKVLDGLAVLKGLNAGIGTKAAASSAPAATDTDTLGGEDLKKGKGDPLAKQKKAWELAQAQYKLQEAQAADSEDAIIGIKLAAQQKALELFGQYSTQYLAASTDLQNALNKEERDAARIQKEVDKAAFDERKRGWETLFSGIQNALEQSVMGIIQGTTTASQAIKKLLQSITLEYINLGLKTLIAHKATELAKTGATAQGTAQRMALESWAAIKSVALSAWSAIKSIGIYAIEGAAAAFKAIAAIPFVGPFMAPAAAAAAGIAIMGFAGHVASAEGGYDIPRGLNPMTQLHSAEMVLPAELANRVRGMTGDGAGSGGSVHFNVSAIDGASVKKFFVEHGDKIIAVVQKGARDFKLDG